MPLRGLLFRMTVVELSRSRRENYCIIYIVSKLLQIGYYFQLGWWVFRMLSMRIWLEVSLVVTHLHSTSALGHPWREKWMTYLYCTCLYVHTYDFHGDDHATKEMLSGGSTSTTQIHTQYYASRIKRSICDMYSLCVSGVQQATRHCQKSMLIWQKSSWQ